jgi:uncharacterized protein YuzE
MNSFLRYDKHADAAYIGLRPDIRPGEVARSESCDLEMREAAIIVQFDSSDRLVGIEILGASKVLSPDILDK